MCACIWACMCGFNLGNSNKLIGSSDVLLCARCFTVYSTLFFYAKAQHKHTLSDLQLNRFLSVLTSPTATSLWECNSLAHTGPSMTFFALHERVNMLFRTPYQIIHSTMLTCLTKTYELVMPVNGAACISCFQSLHVPQWL